MMRRRLPWVLVALLFVVWAHDLYDGHLGDPDRAVSEAKIESALIYADRNLRVEDYAEKQSGFLKWIIDPAAGDTLDQARDGLELYEQEPNFDANSRRALAVMREEAGTPQEDLSKLDSLTQNVLEELPVGDEDLKQLTEDLSAGNGRWWDAILAERLLDYQPDEPLSRALAAHRDQDRTLYYRTGLSYATVWLLSIIGLLFVPHAIITVRRGWTISSLHRPVRYGSRWEPSLVVGIFIAADLAAGYFYQGAYLAGTTLQPLFAAIEHLWQRLAPALPLHFLFDIGIDTMWRLLAPALALVILFRKPSHAIRSLGLNTVPRWGLILAAFAVLSWWNYGFNHLMQPWMEYDPSGGLDLLEKGKGGLFYGVLSGCLVAPISEEIFYRGILLRGLERRFGFWLSAAVVSVVFALAHFYDIFGLISVGVLGFTMVVLFRATGSLTTLIVLHSLYNLTITLPEWLLYFSKP